MSSSELDNSRIAPVQKPKKKFRWKVEDTDSPKEIYNLTLAFSVLIFGIFGAGRGLDEGVLVLKPRNHLNTNLVLMTSQNLSIRLPT